MAEFTNKDIMTLREKTGVGMMDCKKALIETNGDFEEAVKYLREKGISSAAKKADRIAAEGLVSCIVRPDKKVGIAVEVNCETDFVTRSDAFVALVGNIANQVLEGNAETVEQLLAEKCISDNSKTVNDVIGEAVASIGEKISLRRFVKYQTNENGLVNSYLHMGGKIGVLVELNSNSKNTEALVELSHNLAMQIAAAKPVVVGVENVDPVALNAEKEILTAQARNEGRPEAIIEKMVSGRINKYFKEVCLLEQEYVRDNALTVKQVIADVEKSTNSKIQVVRFSRFEMGEGIEKRVDNFVDEIQQQLNSLN